MATQGQSNTAGNYFSINRQNVIILGMAILSRPSFLKNSQDLLADVYITYAWFVYI